MPRLESEEPESARVNAGAFHWSHQSGSCVVLVVTERMVAPSTIVSAFGGQLRYGW